jgi:MoxR-like ATPase
LAAEVKQIISSDDMLEMQADVDRVNATDDVLRYLSRLVRATRSSPDCQLGLSPRGALALLAASKAWAYMDSRSHLVPDDVQAVFLAVAAHRLSPGSSFVGSTADLAQSFLETTDVLGPN